MIALTFDDGPNDPYTSQILEALDSHKAKATFFVLGKWALRSPQTVIDAVNLGHEIGNHSFSHPSFNLIPREEAERDRIKGKIAIPANTTLFRAPFGNVPEWLTDSVGWDIHGSDWITQNPDEICKPIFKYLDDNPDKDTIVLLHDGSAREWEADRSGTVEATRRILARYNNFCTVSELTSHAPIS